MIRIETLISGERNLYSQGDDDALDMPTPERPEGAPQPQPEPFSVPEEPSRFAKFR